MDPDYRYYGLAERSQFQKAFIYAYWNLGRPEDIVGTVPIGQRLQFRRAVEERLLRHALHAQPILFAYGDGLDANALSNDGFKVDVAEAAKAVAMQHGHSVPSARRLPLSAGTESAHPRSSTSIASVDDDG